MDGSEQLVETCPDSRRLEALRKLHEQLPADQRDGLAEALGRVDSDDRAAWEGLLVTLTAPDRGGRREVRSALWLQPMPGNTAVVWPPCSTAAWADELLRAAARLCDERGISVAQMIVSPQDGFAASRLEACGFPRLAELVYLYADLHGPDALLKQQSGAHETEPGWGDLAFAPYADERAAEFAALMEQTYEETQDCPNLEGVREMAEVLTGYRAQGRFNPGLWYFVQTGGDDVGVLVLADHPAAQNCELVYMGLIPRARGSGLGRQIVNFARRRALQAGAQRLVLAVDAANGPALAAYRAAGLVEWERRTVHARMRRVRSK